MGSSDLAVSVVMATKDRAGRLEAALASLRAQSLEQERFEVVVVDDGSRDGTSAVLDVAAPNVRALRHKRSRGPAAARNAGWRAARGRLVAFMDDDCVASPGWLAAGLAAWDGDDRRFIQGATTPMEGEMDGYGPTAYTIDIRAMTPEFPTCNMFYPRVLLERIGGFDAAAFPHVGEDTDLAWRARAAGAEPVFAPAAHVRHAVVVLGRRGFLRRCWRWGDAMGLFARHPPLRRERLFYRWFWNISHFWAARLWVAVALPGGRALWPLKLWLAGRYVRHRLPHPRDGRRSLASLAWFLLVDTLEMAGSLRGSLRHGTVVL